MTRPDGPVPAGPVRDRAPTPTSTSTRTRRHGHQQLQQQRLSATEETFRSEERARSLRTQQRAWAAPTPSHPVPTGKPAVLGVSREETAYWSVFHP